MSNYTTELGQTFRKIETVAGFNIWYDRDEGEYVVSPSNPDDAAAYFTDDLEDARGTAKMIAPTEDDTIRDKEAERLSWTITEVVKDGPEQQVIICKRPERNLPYPNRPYHVTTFTKDLGSFAGSTYDCTLDEARQIADRKSIAQAGAFWVNQQLVAAMVNDEMDAITDEEEAQVEAFEDAGWFTGSPNVLDHEEDFRKCDITGLAGDCILVEYRRWA